MNTTDRDYCGDMRKVIDEATAEGPYSPPIVAGEIVEKLRANDPELLMGWLDEQADHFVWQAINDRDRSRRAVTVHRAKGKAFGAAAEAHKAGDSTTLRRFLDAPYTVEDGTRRPLADLNRDDLLFVANGYQARANENALKASFMTALAKKVGKGVVADHFTEDQLSSMFESLGG